MYLGLPFQNGGLMLEKGLKTEQVAEKYGCQVGAEDGLLMASGK